LLIKIVFKAVRSTMAWQKIPMLVTPENTHTVFGPLAELVAVAKEMLDLDFEGWVLALI
jgi:hypothetical protein